MRTYTKTLFFLLAAFLLGSCSNTRDEKRVLIFSKAIKFYHESIPAGVAAVTKLCQENGIAVDTTTNGAYFQEDSLAKYSTVIFLNTSGEILDYRQQADFERYIQAGGGYVGIHCASATEYQWPWYNQLVGAWFNGHPKPQDGRVNPTGISHPSVDHITETWARFDEWYNFRQMNDGLNVLLTLDETSYTGGKHGDYHPIAWYRDFDGGRSFYTAMGHTIEAYSEEPFMQHVLGGIQYAIGENLKPDYTKATSQRVPADDFFVKVTLDEKLNEPMELTVLPDGRVLFVERRGDVHLYLPEERKTILSAHIDVHDDYEEGLLGITADPGFEENQWIYMYYSPKGEKSIQRLSRFTMAGNEVAAGSEKVMLELFSQREECCHSAGSLTFGADGLLFLSLGDNTNPLTFTHYDRAHIFAPHDERQGRQNWDAQRSAGNTNDLRGSIIRIKPEKDGTYSIPDGNLFTPGDSLTRPEIYVMGARNPFRISVDKHKNYLYFGEVGTDTGSDTERGPRGYDEFNQVREAGNYGWPYAIADNKVYNRYNFDTDELGGPFNADKPENRSVNNTGKKILPPAIPAMIWYPYEVSDEFPSLGTGGRNAMAGPVYYYDDYPDSGRKFPKYYDGKWFIYEWMRNWIKVVTFDEADSFKQVEPFLPGIELVSPMDMEFGPDGALYMLEYGTNWFTGNDDARLIRIDYNDQNRLPVAVITGNNTVGAVPLKTTLSAGNSFDLDKDDKLQFTWHLMGEVPEEIGTGTTLQYDFTRPGTYMVGLTATDSRGGVAGTSMKILAGNQPPEIDIRIQDNRTFYRPGSPIKYSLQVEDREDGSLSAGSISPDSVSFQISYLKDVTPADGMVINTSPHREGMALIGGSDCKSCHSIDQPSIGPTYQAIAARYAGQEEALNTLAEKVVSGGGGNWGSDHVMAAHPALSLDEARQMVGYILSVSQESGAGMLPMEGTYSTRETVQPGGIYILEASYTDKGAEGIEPLTTTKRIVLRPLRVEAEDCDAFTDMAKERPSSTNYMRVAPLANPASLVFHDMDLSGLSGVRLRVSAVQEGGILEFRTGGLTGELFGTVAIPSTGNDLTWKEVTAKFTSVPPAGSDLYLVFRNTDEQRKSRMFFLDWFELLNNPR